MKKTEQYGSGIQDCMGKGNQEQIRIFPIEPSEENAGYKSNRYADSQIRINYVDKSE